MKQRERGELLAYAGTLNTVERQTAQRNGLRVATLRVLLRLGALVETGALVRGSDIGNAQPSGADECWEHLRLLRGKHLATLQGGGIISGHYLVEPAGRAICNEFASAWRRAALAFYTFEPAAPYLRLEPRKT